MIHSKTTSIVDLIFDKDFKNWLKKGKPNDSIFSNLAIETLEEASVIISTFESQKVCFSKQEINDKYSDVMNRINQD